MKAGIFYHPDFADKGHSSLRHRIKPAFHALQGLIEARGIQVFTPIVDAAMEDMLVQTHSPEHIKKVKAEGYHEVALISAAGVVEAAVLLAQGELDFAFCFVGTAGHHASYISYWGFCYYNDVAMALKRLRQQGVQKVMIIDVDPHDGDGTRNYVAADADAIHINFYDDERGIFMNREYNNYDIGVDNADDEYFFHQMDKVLSQDWDFEFLILILGHDAHRHDYGHVHLSDEAFVQMAEKIKKFAAQRPILVVLSGGSNPRVAERVIPAVIKTFTE